MLKSSPCVSFCKHLSYSAHATLSIFPRISNGFGPFFFFFLWTSDNASTFLYGFRILVVAPAPEGNSVRISSAAVFLQYHRVAQGINTAASGAHHTLWLHVTSVIRRAYLLNTNEMFRWANVRNESLSKGGIPTGI